MNSIRLTSPTGQQEPASFDSLKQAILTYPNSYWRQGSGDASLSTIAPNGVDKELLILPNETYGIYLKYIERSNSKIVATWLSLGNSTRLNQTATVGDEWHVSIGLFLSREATWLAISDFIELQRRSERISWISPSDLPEGGNW